MTMYNPAHPGEILKDLIMAPQELTVTGVSGLLGISRKTLSRILKGRSAITPEMAVRLELVFKKPSADRWLRLQKAHDLWQTRQHLTELHVKPYMATFT